ncbi:MAG: 3'-5' exonuclease, partial [Planctomycetota bacterium]
AADALIANNRGRRHKELWTENAEGDLVKVVTCADEKQEATWITEEFQRLHDEEQVAWGQMAMFYRINSLSRVMEETLLKAGLPYQIARGTAFYDRKEIKDAIAYLRVVANPSDEVNLLRVINTPARGISAASVKAMQAFALANHQPIDELLGDPLRVTALNTRAQTSVAKFGKIVDQWRHTAGITAEQERDPSAPQPSLRGFVEDVLRESGLETFYRNDKSDPDQERLANLGELVTSAQQFEEEYEFEAEQAGEYEQVNLREKLLAFLERIALVSDADGVDDSQGMITLMTLHAAKGLEYTVVAMIGVEDGLLPHDRANDDPQELEEERRLAFVGITRAEQRLYLCHGKYRTVFGQTMPTIRSRFLTELPADVLDEIDPSSDPDAYEDELFTGGGGTQRALASNQAGQYPPGTLVKHPQFGLGRVVKVSPMGAHTRAKIDFTTSGSKTLILQYARLEVIDV